MPPEGILTTALLDWLVQYPDGLTIADYEAFPDDVRRRIEVIDGATLVPLAPSRPHQTITRRLANLIEAACGPEHAVITDVELRLRDIPLLIRRPDIVVYDSSLPCDAVLRPEHCLLAVEVMSPWSLTTDQLHKPAEYAVAGIEHFWRVEYHRSALTVFAYRLDPTTRTYVSAGMHVDKMVVSHPFAVSVDLTTLL